MVTRFPVEIQYFAERFAGMQDKRELADYEPAGNFEQLAVIADINLAEDSIAKFRQAQERDRRTFAVFVLLNVRST